MSDNVTMAYLAGLVDGEAYIGIKKSQRRDCAAPTYHARIQLRMVDEEAIKFLAETFGGTYYREKPRFAKGRALFCFQASDASAERVLTALLPYLRVKVANARDVLAFRNIQAGARAHRTKLVGTRQFQGYRGGMRTVRTMGLSDEYVALCEASYQHCKMLNHV